MKPPKLLLALALLALVAGCGSGESGGERADCAAARLEPDLDPDPTLPDTVAETEVAIVRAAVACDDDRLEALADFKLRDPRFTTLVELFEGPIVLDGETYVWPGVEEGGVRTAIAADGTWQYYETGRAETAPPTEIVAALGDRLVVLSSADGSVVRTLVEGYVGVSTAAVSTDGQTVYFTAQDSNVICDEGLPTHVVTVPITGGTPQSFASGQGAVVSPDGKRTAYATGGANQCRPPNQLVVQELGTERFTQELFEGGDALIVPLMWSPDSRRVLYSFQTTDDVQAREVEPGTGEPPRTIPVPEGAYLPTYLDDAGSLAVVRDDGTDAQVLEVDAIDGEVRRTLFAVADRPAFRSMVADSSGRHLLFTTFAAVIGDDRIWRWAGGGEPVVVLEAAGGELVEDAVWLSAPSAS
jgi:hypothetical protein